MSQSTEHKLGILSNSRWLVKFNDTIKEGGYWFWSVKGLVMEKKGGKFVVDNEEKCVAVTNSFSPKTCNKYFVLENNGITMDFPSKF